jgi:hypothetical protein
MAKVLFLFLFIAIMCHIQSDTVLFAAKKIILDYMKTVRHLAVLWPVRLY